MNKVKIAVVVVTYNRLNKLKIALASYGSQIEQCNDLIVVNNNCTDGTKEYLKEWELQPSRFKKHVLNLKENTGGAGGFYAGQKFCLSLKPDWVYLADDDAYLHRDAFRNFYQFVEQDNKSCKYSAIVGAVYNNGNIQTEHRRHLKFTYKPNVKNSILDNYSKSSFIINQLSYVGCFLNVDALRSKGLVNPDLFIYYDDSEHSLRISKYGPIVCVPNIIIDHDFEEPLIQNINKKFGWKDYYECRNSIYMYSKYSFISFVYIVIFRLLYILVTKNRTVDEKRLYLKAIKDGVFRNLGKSSTYLPGFTI